jgi:hypothetical protein
VQSNIKFRYDPSNFEMNDLAPAQERLRPVFELISVLN